MIHKTAVIGPRVKIGRGCEIGPFCVIEGDVELGPNNHLVSHVRIEGKTFVGSHNTFYPFCSIGGVPQDLKYANEDSGVRIGNHNSIREGVTIHRGTKGGLPAFEQMTFVGNSNLIMAYSHVAHDCVIGNHCILANSTQLAGHVSMGDYARLGGANLVVQFVRIGEYAFTGAGVVIRKDISPFVLGAGDPVFKPSGINVVGLQRNEVPEEIISDLKELYRIFYQQRKTQSEALSEISRASWKATKEVERFVRFVEQSKLGVHR